LLLIDIHALYYFKQVYETITNLYRRFRIEYTSNQTFYNLFTNQRLCNYLNLILFFPTMPILLKHLLYKLHILPKLFTTNFT